MLEIPSHSESKLPHCEIIRISYQLRKYEVLGSEIKLKY